MPDRRNTDHWSLDKKIPLAFLLAVFLQTAGIIWWAATTTARVSGLEDQATIAETLNERVDRTEVILINVENVLNKLDKTLTQLSNTKQKD